MSRIHLAVWPSVLLLSLLLVGCGGSGGLGDIIGDQIVVRGSGELATEERELPAFTAIHVASSANVVLKAGAEQQVIASADDNVLPYLRTEVEGDTLTVDLRADSPGRLSILDTQHTPQVEVTAPNIDELVINSSGNVTADLLEGEQVSIEIHSSGDMSIATVHADNMQIDVTSSGDLLIPELAAETLEVSLSSSGSATVAGAVQMQEIRLSSSGNYEAGELRSEEATVRLSSSGNATLWVSGSLNAERNSSGQVRYYGNPPEVRGEVTALGGR